MTYIKCFFRYLRLRKIGGPGSRVRTYPLNRPPTTPVHGSFCGGTLKLVGEIIYQEHQPHLSTKDIHSLRRLEYNHTSRALCGIQNVAQYPKRP